MKNNECHRLLAEIDGLRNKLQKLVFRDKKSFNDNEVLQVSANMDRLIYRYMEANSLV